MQTQSRQPGSVSGQPSTGSGQRVALIMAVLIVVLLQRLVPYGQYLLYPFTLLATWVHEMGHGVTALLCGGRFEQLQIFRDASGLALTAVPPGLREALTAAGGLIAPPLCGALMLALGRRFSRVILWGLAAALAISLVLYVRTQVGWLAMTPLLVLVVLVARYGGYDGRLFATQLIGVLLGLDTVMRMGYLFVASAAVGGTQRMSDVAGVAKVLGGPFQLWGGLIAGLSIMLLLLGLWAAWGGGRNQTAA